MLPRMPTYFPEEEDVFWPGGKYSEQSRDGGSVYHQDSLSFVAEFLTPRIKLSRFGSYPPSVLSHSSIVEVLPETLLIVSQSSDAVMLQLKPKDASQF